MKRVLIFSVAYHPFVGGAEVAVKEITDRVDNVEWDMITLNLDGKQLSCEKIGNVTVYRIGGRGKIYKLLFPFTAWLKARKLERLKPYDTTWSIMASFSGFAALFFKLSHPRIKFVLTLQEGDPISYIKRQVWFVYPIFKYIFKRADTIQTISTYLANFARDMGARVEPIVIPNGVNIELFSAKPLEEKVQAVQQKVGKKSGDVFLVTTSRLVKKNGIADVINALPFLPNNVKFVILGNGPLRSALDSIVKKQQLESRVVFFGFVDYKNIPEYLAACDIFIRPSLSEGMGNSFIEAMAAGLPVIATPVGGIPDFLTNGATGLMCEPENPKSIAEKVGLLIKSVDLRSRIIEQARTMVRRKYDWSQISERMKKEIFE